jgi:hypothetical protein
VYGLGLHVTCSCMAGGIAKGISGSLIGILGEGCSFGMKVGLRMMTTIVGDNEMCG